MGNSQFTPLTNPRTVLVAGAPTVNDDNTIGYAVGNIWHDTTNDVAYRCSDASTGAAAWELISTKPDDSTVETISNGTLRVKDSGITPAKLQYPVTTYKSSSSGNHSENSASYQDVTNLSLTFNANGRDVLFMLVNDQSGSVSVMSADDGGVGYSFIGIRLIRGATPISEQTFTHNSGNATEYATPSFLAASETGSNTYKIQCRVNSSPSQTATLKYFKLVAVVL